MFHLQFDLQITWNPYDLHSIIKKRNQEDGNLLTTDGSKFKKKKKKLVFSVGICPFCQSSLNGKLGFSDHLNPLHCTPISLTSNSPFCFVTKDSVSESLVLFSHFSAHLVSHLVPWYFLKYVTHLHFHPHLQYHQPFSGCCSRQWLLFLLIFIGI